jgi:hypothetical protein
MSPTCYCMMHWGWRLTPPAQTFTCKLSLHIILHFIYPYQNIINSQRIDGIYWNRPAHSIAATCRTWRSITVWIVIDTHMACLCTCKPAFSSLPPYHTLLQAFLMFLKEIFVEKHKIQYHMLFCADSFKCDEPTICRDNQTADIWHR